jgi:hypothetical protein
LALRPCHYLYDTATDHARKLLNKAIFTRLYVDMHPTRQPTVTTGDLHEPFGSLIHATRSADTTRQPQDPQHITHGCQDDAHYTVAASSPRPLQGQSASKAATVEKGTRTPKKRGCPGHRPGHPRWSYWPPTRTQRKLLT